MAYFLKVRRILVCAYDRSSFHKIDLIGGMFRFGSEDMKLLFNLGKGCLPDLIQSYIKSKYRYSKLGEIAV
jgi:hypothetical protein